MRLQRLLILFFTLFTVLAMTSCSGDGDSDSNPDEKPVVEGSWQNIIYPDVPEEKKYFGLAVDIDDENMAIAASDGIYIYTKGNSGDYEQVQHLTVAGSSVAVDGDYLVVGNGYHTYVNTDDTGYKSNAGIVYIYKKDSTSKYQKVTEITPDDIASNDHFGSVVDISGDLIIVGASNAYYHHGLAYLIQNDGEDNFVIVERISRENGKPYDNFGASVAIDGDFFVVGASAQSYYRSTGTDYKLELGAGFANYYNYINNELQLMQVLTPDDSTELSDGFGKSVSISGEQIAVSAPYNSGRGSVYIYQRAFPTFTLEAKIEGEIDSQNFGNSVAIDYRDSNILAIGTLRDMAYMAVQNGATYEVSAYSINSDRTVNGPVAVDKNDIVFSARDNSDQALKSGAVIVRNVYETITSANDDVVADLYFVEREDVALSSIQMDDILVSGINKPVSISIEGGQYSLDAGLHWSSLESSINNNQRVFVRHTSSSSFGTKVDTRLIVGSVDGLFSSTTRPSNYVPRATRDTVAIETNSLNNLIVLHGTDRDAHSLVFSVVDSPLHGVITGTAPDVLYTPNADYIGLDSFTFNASDASDISRPVSVKLNVNRVVHKGIAYGTVVSPNTNKVWLDRNLGASLLCRSSDDAKCYGDYYQWGRKTDGHEKVSSFVDGLYTYDQQSNSVESAGSDFIMGDRTNHDWTTIDTDADGALRMLNWSKVDAHYACPLNYRVPTIDEFAAEIGSSTSGMGSFLKLPSAGYRSSTGVYTDGTNGKMWSSSASGTEARYLGYSSSSLLVSATDKVRENAYSLRCITDMPVPVPINVLKTGVTVSQTIGDDGHYKKGQDRNYTRDDVNGIVTDHTTGLQWQDNAVVDYYIYSGYDGSQAQDKAITYCAAKEMGGYDDWRLPGIEELLTIVDYSSVSPSLDSTFIHVDTNESAGFYWTSTKLAGSNLYGWEVSFTTGEHHYHGLDSEDKVRCVRGTKIAENQFYRFESDIVKDFSTNLSWQDTNMGSESNISDAITYCSDLVIANESSWRVPNMNELLTLVDFTATQFTTISSVFINQSEWAHISSTPNTMQDGYWFQLFNEGGSDNGSGSGLDYRVRCVSGENKYIDVPIN